MYEEKTVGEQKTHKKRNLLNRLIITSIIIQVLLLILADHVRWVFYYHGVDSYMICRGWMAVILVLLSIKIIIWKKGLGVVFVAALWLVGGIYIFTFMFLLTQMRDCDYRYVFSPDKKYEILVQADFVGGYFFYEPVFPGFYKTVGHFRPPLDDTHLFEHLKVSWEGDDVCFFYDEEFYRELKLD